MRVLTKRLVSLAFAALVLVSALPVSTAEAAPEISATAAILVDASSGQVLYERNADRKMLIASTTKIMTALIAMRDGNLSDTVTVSAHAAATEGSSMYLKAGEKLSLEALLYGVLLSSGNDAAAAVAEHIAGSETAFAQRMNEKAQELGMTNSSFANPHGLDHPDHYSTARDMAKLAAAAMEDPVFRRIASTRTATVAGRTLTNHNKLLGTLDGCIGLKTGYTRAAGRTLVTCVEREGRRLVAVTLQDGNDWADHTSLYAYGFAQPVAPAAPAPIQGSYTLRPLVSSGTYMGDAPVSGGAFPAVPLMADTDLACRVPEGAQVSCRLLLYGTLQAPVTAGTRAGEAVFTAGGVEIGRVSVLCAVNIPAAA